MKLTVGEIAKALGISNELIRYYVEEGLIHPTRNEKNGYWEYSSEDIIKLTDILFYRRHQFSMKDIKTIMNGIPLEDIGNIIHQRKSELIEEVKRKTEAIYELDRWESLYNEELHLIGQYTIGPMPLELRCSPYIEQNKHIATYLDEFFNLNKDNWADVSTSYFYDMNEDIPQLKQYLSVPGTKEIQYSTIKGQIIEEQADRCLITEVYHSDDFLNCFQSIVIYAKEKQLKLKGQFYIRENTCYFQNQKRLSLYKIYAPII